MNIAHIRRAWLVLVAMLSSCSFASAETWSVYEDMTVEITDLENSNTVLPGQEVTLNTTVTDLDCGSESGVTGDEENVVITWSGDVPSSTTGTSLAWTAPPYPGTYTITATATQTTSTRAIDTGSSYDSITITVVEVKDLVFTVNPLSTDEGSTSTASATVTPTGRTLVYSIQGTALDCSIDSSTGVITAGDTTTAGQITVRAADSALATAYAEANLTLAVPESLILKDLASSEQEVDQANGGTAPVLYVDVDADGYGDVSFWILDPPTSQTSYAWEIRQGETQKYYGTLNYGNTWQATQDNIPAGEYTLNVTRDGVDRQINFKVKEIDISAYSDAGSFPGYATRVTGTSKFAFASGKDFLDGLTTATTNNGKVGHIYVFSHAWLYKSEPGTAHSGGFWGAWGDKGFYGAVVQGDHADARDVSHLQAAIANGTIKLAAGKKIFVEGCHVWEIGTFAKNLATVTGRTVVCGAGAVAEKSLTDNSVTFECGAQNFDEKTDPDFDGWVEGKNQLAGANYVVPF